MKRVEFYYDLVSPYSYLAHGQIERLCEENGAELILRPMLLGAVHKAAGIKAPIETKAKADYQARDIRRWAEYYGVPLEFPDPFPFRTLKTMRAAMFLRERGGSRPSPAGRSLCTGRRAAPPKASKRQMRTVRSHP